MKKGIKVFVFIVACLVVITIIGTLKQHLQQSEAPAAIGWVAIPIIFILYFIMFRRTK